MSTTRAATRWSRRLAAPALAVALCLAGSSAGAIAPRATWSLRASLPGSTQFEDLSCVSAATCVAVGGGQLASIYRTTDAGSSWQRVVPPAGVSSLDDVACASNGFCLAEHWDGRWADGFIISTDAGATWSTGAGTVSGLASTVLLACVAPSTCYASNGPDLYVSADAFVTKTTVTTAAHELADAHDTSAPVPDPTGIVAAIVIVAPATLRTASVEELTVA